MHLSASIDRLSQSRQPNPIQPTPTQPGSTQPDSTHSNPPHPNQIQPNPTQPNQLLCRWVEGLGLQLLAHAITALEVDVVLVMKHDRLYADMLATLPRSVAVINLPRSGGATSWP